MANADQLGSRDESSDRVKIRTSVGFRIYTCRTRFRFHTCLSPAKFEDLSDLLSPELVQACLAETARFPLRRRRMPMERVLWAIIGMSLFRHVPMA